MHPGKLLAAVAYMTDMTVDGCFYHSWRVALISQQIAAQLAPPIQRDVFYAGLLQDVGAVGAMNHITHYSTLRRMVDDPHIKNHPQRSSALTDWLPGMALAADFVKWHHEWWNGQGFPDSLRGDRIPLGSQILRIADAVDIAGSFNPGANIMQCLQSLAPLTGQQWSKDIWAALISSTKDTALYRALMDHYAIPDLLLSKIEEIGVPAELDNEEGIERIFHVFAAAVDLKDPSTAGHSLRVARYAQSLAKHMRLSDEDAHMAYRAGLVHDCGRLGLPTHVINNSGRLSDKQLDLVRKHASMTIRVMNCMRNCPEMSALGEIAGHDHERHDGNGYPDGWAGERIPMVSRILSAVDAFDAMISPRSYRLLSPKAAVIRIQQGAGTQFDPVVAGAMISAVDSGALVSEAKSAA